MVKRASNAGITEFIFVVGYRLESITERFEDGSDFGTKIEYVVQKEQLGTGHALMVAEEMAKDRFLVLNGDVLTDESSLKWMVGTDGLAVAAKRVPDPSRYGVFEVERGS